ncbi:MAG TPA: hypothetical protein VE088_03565 [Gaiellaceae bacterium]|jgi:hypothetical protein|nr:hypothetical protein [Gaiellaceae bacterium]
MDAAQALADLLEVSPQVEAAAIFRGEELLGAVGVDDEAAGRVVGSAGRLLDAAGASRSGGARVTQVRASLAGTGVFVVREPEGERAAVAVASRAATPGLVFYDLKRCLAATAEQPKPKPRRRRTKKEEPADDAP